MYIYIYIHFEIIVININANITNLFCANDGESVGGGLREIQLTGKNGQERPKSFNNLDRKHMRTLVHEAKTVAVEERQNQRNCVLHIRSYQRDFARQNEVDRQIGDVRDNRQHR